MILCDEASLLHLSIHLVGNKLLEEPVVLGEHPIELKDEMLDDLLKQFFLWPFEKVNEIYRLSLPAENEEVNKVYHFAEAIFKQPNDFHAATQQLVQHLFDAGNHPKIKAGEVYFGYFRNLHIEDEMLDAIGIFKSESKEPYLNVTQQGQDFELGYEPRAINIKKLDKGCLIFKTDKEQGYKVAIIDQTNQQEAAYWKNDFLGAKLRGDEYSFTNNFLKLTKQFITNGLPGEHEMPKTAQVNFLNKSVDYFKENDTFNINDFQAEVFEDEALIRSFQQFGAQYSNNNDIDIADSFPISDQAVRKQARAFKSVLKLDKNFHIYIHGSQDLIEKGYDNVTGKNFYKIYFDEEM